jgi:hypothetical protein
MDAVETSYSPRHTPRKLAFALALSVALHLLLVWYMSNWYPTKWGNLPSSSLSRPLNITITAPKALDIKQPQTPLPAPTTDQSPRIQPQPKKESNDSAKTAMSKKTLSGDIKERPVTTAQIKQSAAAVIRDLTDDDEGVQMQRPDSVSTILERALDKPSETPGIFSQADGTTRVVTEQGFTYCMKPLEDWRIIDPGDDMRVSGYCQ